MKSEHRHELETNELSASLAKSIEQLKPLSGQILVVVGLLLGLYAGLTIWNSQTAQTEQEAWEAYAFATDSIDPELDDLQKVADDERYAGTRMSEWAYVSWADRQTLSAMRYYFLDREKTDEFLRNAEGIYQQFGSNASDEVVMNQARFGLARVYELQNKIDEARTQYLTVRGSLQPKAAERAEHLQSDSVKEATEWLATAELPQRDLTGGMGASGARPSFDAAVPAATSSKDSITEESLEELLRDLEGDSTEKSSFGEKGEGFSTEGTGEVPAEEATPSDADAADKVSVESANEPPSDTEGSEADSAAE